MFRPKSLKTAPSGFRIMLEITTERAQPLDVSLRSAFSTRAREDLDAALIARSAPPQVRTQICAPHASAYSDSRPG
jgi:hypothetical protein